MVITRKALVTIGMTIGAVAVGGAASAAVGHLSGPDATVEATTVPTSTTTAESTTTDASTSTSTAETTSTTMATTTTTAPATTTTTAAEAPFGLCNAFSGRPQPGNSRAWQRLDEQAGGDIEKFCHDALARHHDDQTNDSVDGSDGSDGPDSEDGADHKGDAPGDGHSQPPRAGGQQYDDGAPGAKPGSNG